MPTALRRRPVGAGLLLPGLATAFRALALKAVEDEVAPERQLDGVVPPAEAALVTRSERDGGDPRIGGQELARHGGGVGRGLRGVVEQGLAKPEDAAAE